MKSKYRSHDYYDRKLPLTHQSSTRLRRRRLQGQVFTAGGADHAILASGGHYRRRRPDATRHLLHPKAMFQSEEGVDDVVVRRRRGYSVWLGGLWRGAGCYQLLDGRQEVNCADIVLLALTLMDINIDTDNDGCADNANVGQ